MKIALWKSGKGQWRGDTTPAVITDVFLIHTPVSTDAFINKGEDGSNKYITHTDLTSDGSNRITYSGGIDWDADYDYNSGIYKGVIGGIFYESSISNFTLTPGGAQDRIDTLVFTFDGSSKEGKIIVIEGDEAPVPVAKDINEETQIFITTIPVAAGTTEPVGINLVIYNENIESTFSGDGDPAYATAPFTGSVSTRALNFADGNTLEYLMAAAFSTKERDGLQFRIAAETVFPNNATLQVAFYLGANKVSDWVVIHSKPKAGRPYYFDSRGTGWSTVFVNNGIFNFSAETADKVVIKKADGKADVTFRLDLLRLQNDVGGSNIGYQKTKLSEFINDTNFITLTDLPETADLIDIVTVGENVVKGDHVYLSNDGKWWKTNAISKVFSTTEVRVSLGTILADASGSVLIKGSITLSGLIAGDKYWLAEVTGTITNDYSGFIGTSVIRYIGTAISATEFEYNPDKTSIQKDGTEINGVPMAGGNSTVVENEYATMATMYADQVGQTATFLQYVADASGHPDFGVVAWYFEYLGTTVGDETDYRPLSQQEVNAVQLQADYTQALVSSPDYIKNKPTLLSEFTNDLLMSFGVADMIHGIGDDITVVDNVVTFRPPFGIELTNVYATVDEAPTGSNIITDITLNGVTILSTLLSIDATEESSSTATTPAVISTTTIPAFSEVSFNIDQVGSTLTGKGIKWWMVGTKI